MTRRQFLRSTGLAILILPLVPCGRALAQTVEPIMVRPDLGILPRQAWAADRGPKGPLGREDVRFLLVHHTASSNDYAAEDVPRLLAGFYDHHTSAGKGWSDIAYNFLIDRQGRIWEGRQGSIDGPVAGDATGGNQGYSQLCCLIGDFTTVLPTSEAVAALTALLSWLADRYQIDTSPGATVQFESKGSNRWPTGAVVETLTIAGHRDMSHTSCPGDAFYPYVVDELATNVDAVREPQVVTTTVVATTVTSTVPPEPTTVPPSTTSTLSPATSTTGVTSSSAPLASIEAAEGTSGLARTLFAVGSIAAVTGAAVAIRKAQTRSGEDDADE